MCQRRQARHKEINPPLPPPRGIPQPHSPQPLAASSVGVMRSSIVFLSALGGRGFCSETPRLQRGRAFYFFVKIHAPAVKSI